jgi:tRNA(Ile)-lysidine synthase
MAEVMAGDHETLQKVLAGARAQTLTAESAFSVTLDLAAFRSLPLGVRRALVREAVGQLRADLRDIPFTPVEAAVRLAQNGPTGASASLPGGLALTVGYDELLIASEAGVGETPEMPLLPPGADIPVGVPGLTRLPGGTRALRAEIGDWPLAEIETNDDPWQAYVAWGKPAPLRLRTRRPGERFRPQGMAGAEPKLSDFMIAQKVPRGWRERLPLLVRGDEILWVCGWRVSEAARVRAPDMPVLRLRFEPIGPKTQ